MRHGIDTAGKRWCSQRRVNTRAWLEVPTLSVREPGRSRHPARPLRAAPTGVFRLAFRPAKSEPRPSTTAFRWSAFAPDLVEVFLSSASMPSPAIPEHAQVQAASGASTLDRWTGSACKRHRDARTPAPHRRGVRMGRQPICCPRIRLDRASLQMGRHYSEPRRSGRAAEHARLSKHNSSVSFRLS
jgi:hypothetical protein